MLTFFNDKSPLFHYHKTMLCILLSFLSEETCATVMNSRITGSTYKESMKCFLQVLHKFLQFIHCALVPAGCAF